MAPRRYGHRLLLAVFFDGAVLLLGAAVPNWHFVPAFWIISAAVVLRCAPAVSYRRRDALPGPWLVWLVIGRATSLPYRYWPPRDDELDRAVYLSAADLPGRWRPEYAGMWRLTDEVDPLDMFSRWAAVPAAGLTGA